jgi:hypothetical protein
LAINCSDAALLLARAIVPLVTRVPGLILFSRIGIVTEEADECVFWIELLQDLGVMKKERLQDLLQEARELTAIFNASRQTAKQRR